MQHTSRRALAAGAASVLAAAALTAAVAQPAAAYGDSDFGVEFTSAPSSISVDGAATYVVKVTNGGPNSGAYNVHVETSGAVASITGVTPGCVISGTTINCQDAAKADESWSYQLTAVPSGPGTITVEASVQPDLTSTDPDYGNNAATAATTVVGAEADLDLILGATAGPILTSQITYGLSVHNEGPADATASVVEVVLPTQVSSVSGLPAGCTYASLGDVVTCDIGAIADGATANVSFRASLGLLSLGALPATATRVSSSPNDPNPVDDTSSVTCTTLTSLIISCPATPF